MTVRSKSQNGLRIVDCGRKVPNNLGNLDKVRKFAALK
jgi:hypothetical protein